MRPAELMKFTTFDPFARAPYMRVNTENFHLPLLASVPPNKVKHGS